MRGILTIVVAVAVCGIVPAQNTPQAPRPAQLPGQPERKSTPPITPPNKPAIAPAATPPTKLKPLMGLDPLLMDRTADPCADFYQYSCGGWVKQNPVPPDRSFYGRDAELQERNEVILRDILERAAAAGPNRTSVEQKIGDYYSSCIDEARIDSQGMVPLRGELARIEALKSKTDLADELAHLHLIGVDAFFNYRSNQDFKDATSVIAETDQGGLGLPERDYYTRPDGKSEEIRKQYLAHVTNMLKLLGESADQATGDAQKIMDIESALAKASLTVVERRDPEKLYHKLPLTGLDKMVPLFAWNRYLRATDTPFVQNLNVAVPGFFQGLQSVLQQEDLPSIQTYLRWHLLHRMAPMLSAKFVDENFDFYGRKLEGQKVLRARWKRCVQSTDHELGEALGQKYVEREFPPQNKVRTRKMVKEIEGAMERDIRRLTWMSATTQQRAIEKLHAVANKIGYPDKWRDYSGYEVVPGDALGNFIRGNEFESHRQISKIGKPVDRGEWGMTPPTINAYYNPQMNDINFPAGILQPPYYDAKMNDAVNYGDAGGVIGHELTHGFDDEGSQFDARGNLENWWTEADRKEFDSRTGCVAQEYDQFIATDDVHVNGRLTLGENVADIGGLKLALMAYLEHQAGLPPAVPVDGFTPEQQFFISYGQGWCENDTPEALRLLAQTDPHAPTKYRVNGVVVNLPEFQKAFSCKVGTPMAPKKPCQVW